MATGIKNNKLVLKVSVVYDSAAALKSAKKLQGELDKHYEKSTRKSGMSDDINNSNRAIKEQLGLFGKWKKGVTGVAEKMLQTAGFGAVLYGIIGTMRSAVDLAVQLDTAYTNLAIVSKMTATELVYVDEQINNMTSSLGRMKKEVIDAVTEFSRAGYSIADSMTLAKNAIMGANVGAVGLDKVTTYLIAGLKSFKMEAEDSARILDVLFTVANITAIDLEGIGEAFLRSANTLKSAGATLEEATALLAAANESIQDPAKVGTALKTIASRLRGVGDEGEVIPTLAKDFEAVGIAIQNADGSFRNIYDVFKDLSVVYNELDDLTRQSLLEKLAGKRQINIMIGLLENFDLAEKSLQAGIESAGSVALAQEKYLESLEGRMNLLKEGWNKFLSSLTNTEGIKVAVSALTNLVKVLTFLAEKLPLVLGGITGAGVGLTSLLFPPLAPILLGVGALITAFGLFNQVLVGTKSEAEKAAKAMVKLDGDINDLNSKITNAKSVPEDKRTEAQKEYLALLESELETKEKLRANEQSTIFEQNLKDAKKLRKEVEAIKNADKGMYGNNSKIVTQGDKVTIDRLKAQEAELIKVRQARLLDIESVKKGTPLYKLAQEALYENETALKSLYSGYDALGVVYDNIFNKTNKLTNATNKQEEAQHSASVNAQYAKDKYKILSDAIEQVTTNGYLSDEMFSLLTEKFPDIIKQTGLTAEAMVKYANTNREETNKMIDDDIALLQSKIITITKIRSLYDNLKEINSANGSNITNAFFSATRDIFNKSGASITNAENEIAKLQNLKKAISAIDKNRIETLTKKPLDTSTPKPPKFLTETEKKIRDINHELEKQNKLLERAETQEKRIAITNTIIGAYEKLKTALKEYRTELDLSMKKAKNQAEKDDIVAAMQKTSIETEKTTNKIIELKKGLVDLRKESEKIAKEQTMQKAIKLIKDQTKVLVDSTKLEIKELNKKLKKLQEEYNTRKEAFDLAKEKAEFEKKLAELDEDITKAEIENELLSLDNSIESQRRRAELAEELEKLNKSKQKIMAEEALRQEERRLEKDYKLKVESYEKEIELKETHLAEIERLSELAISNIENNISLSAEEVSKIVSTFTSGMSDAWSDATVSLEEYIRLLSTVLSMSGGEAMSGSITSDTGADKLDEMKKNSAEWHNADDKRKKWLHERNKALAQELGFEFNPKGGYWMYPNGVRVYDNGGKLGKGEVAINKEQDNEWVLTDKNLMTIFEKGMSASGGVIGMRSPSFNSANGVGGGIGNLINIENMNNNLTSDVDVERLGAKLAKGGKSTLSQYGYKF